MEDETTLLLGDNSSDSLVIQRNQNEQLQIEIESTKQKLPAKKKKSQQKLIMYDSECKEDNRSCLEYLWQKLSLGVLDITECTVHAAKLVYECTCCLGLFCFILNRCEHRLSRVSFKQKQQTQQNHTRHHQQQQAQLQSHHHKEDKKNLKTLSNTKKTSETQSAFLDLQRSLRMYNTHSDNLVLDLDQTLIHCCEMQLHPDAMQIQVQGYPNLLYIHLRKNLQQFLEFSAEFFNVYIFTASTKEYSEEIVRIIDSKKIIKEIFSRSKCSFNGKSLLKDLNSLGFDLQRTVMIDNSNEVVQCNPQNCLKISDFTGQNNDNELLRFAVILKEMTVSQMSFPEFILSFNQQTQTLSQPSSPSRSSS